MISIKVDHKNKEVLATITRSEKITKSSMRSALHEIGTENRRELKKQIRTGKRTGRTYTIKGKRHIASAVGEVPKSVTGNLAKSVDYRVRNWNLMDFGVTTNADYMKYLEATRPAVNKIAEEKQRDTQNTLIKYLEKALKKGKQ
jgi:hypothetical protein